MLERFHHKAVHLTDSETVRRVLFSLPIPSCSTRLHSRPSLSDDVGILPFGFCVPSLRPFELPTSL